MHTDTQTSAHPTTHTYSVMGLVKQALTMILSVLNYDISYLMYFKYLLLLLLVGLLLLGFLYMCIEGLIF